MQKTIEDDKHLYHKKIAIRFLKELGLLNTWKQYISKNSHKYTEHKWYEKDYLDSVFGDTCFTSFLSKNYGVKIYSTISELFRYWVIYNEIPHKFKFKMLTLEKEFKEDVFIDKTTKMMSLKNIPNE